MEEKEIKGNLHLLGIEHGVHAHVQAAVRDCLERNGIVLTAYCGRDIPEGSVRMGLADFIREYRGCRVNVEGEVVFELKGE